MTSVSYASEKNWLRPDYLAAVRLFGGCQTNPGRQQDRSACARARLHAKTLLNSIESSHVFSTAPRLLIDRAMQAKRVGNVATYTGCETMLPDIDWGGRPQPLAMCVIESRRRFVL
jgi:hypothetical protein